MDVEAFAPGRVNLIGEHTDYTGGLALPMAIQHGVTVSGQRSHDNLVTLRSRDYDKAVSFSLTELDAYPHGAPAWGRLAHSICAELSKASHDLSGLDAEISSTVPIGGGMSSSAAFSVALALAVAGPLNPGDVAAIAQRAETAASGVPCGVMDPLASASGIVGHATLLDCRTLTTHPVAIPSDWRLLVVHSGQTRLLEHSEYALRAAQCAQVESQIGSLRDRSVDDVAGLSSVLDETLWRRARHVICENQRVLDMVCALAEPDIEAAGALLGESHRSLRDDFEVSTTVLDELVQWLTAQDQVAGARLMGAGFGGCVVALCSSDQLERSIRQDHWWMTPSEGAWVQLNR